MAGRQLAAAQGRRRAPAGGRRRRRRRDRDGWSVVSVARACSCSGSGGESRHATEGRAAGKAGRTARPAPGERAGGRSNGRRRSLLRRSAAVRRTRAVTWPFSMISACRAREREEEARAGRVTRAVQGPRRRSSPPAVETFCPLDCKEPELCFVSIRAGRQQMRRYGAYAIRRIGPNIDGRSRRCEWLKGVLCIDAEGGALHRC